MPVYALAEQQPLIDPTAFVHPDAVVIGEVVIGPEASVWPCAVLRGDWGRIEIGARSSVQDGTVVHAGADHPTTVGAGCVVGHNVHIEGCTIEDDVLLGSMSTVLPRAVVRRGALVAAGAVVPGHTDVPPYALAKGVPVTIEHNAIAAGRWAAGVQGYVDMAARYRRELHVVGTDAERRFRRPGTRRTAR